MAKLHFIGGEKGGVGKSFTSRLLAQYYIDHKKAFIGFDTDPSHETFSRFYGEFVNLISVHDVESVDRILEEAEAHPNQDIIVDLAAQTAFPLQQWMQDCELLDLLQELKFEVFYWHVMDDGADSAYLLTKITQQMQHKNCTVIAVKNEGRGEDFSSFEKAPMYARAIAAGVRFINIPKLQPHLVQKIDFNHLSFWAAAHNTQLISIIERRRVKLWIDQCFKAFSSIFTLQGDGTSSAPVQVVRHEEETMI
jgi:hypothetical protein